MDYIITTHKQIEQTVRYLTVIAEQTREAVIVADFSGAIQFVNTAWATMHGYENCQELIGKQINVFHTKEQMKTDVIPFIEEVKHRGRLAGPVEHVRRNGTPFPTEMLMVVFNDDAGRAMGLVGFATDITKEKRIEEELRRYRCHMEELIKQQTEALEAANSRLQGRVKEHEQAGQKLKQQTAELSAANERLREQICEQERAKDELEEHRDKLEQRLKQQSDELTTVEAQLQNEIARRKKEEEYFKQRTQVLEAANSRLQGQVTEHEQAGQKLMQQTAELSAANERLREQICESERAKDKLEQHREKLEQHLKQQSDELTTVEAQLQDEIAKHKKEGEYSKQQSDAIKAACERLRTRIGELSAHSHIAKTDVCKTIAPLETAVSLSNDEEILVHVFRENVALQKPELVNAAVDKSISKEI